MRTTEEARASTFFHEYPPGGTGRRGLDASRFIVWREHAFVAAVLAALACLGCQPAAETASRAPSPSPATSAGSPESRGRAATAQENESQAASDFSRESWDVIYIKGSRVGFSFTRYEMVEEVGRKLLCIRSRNEMAVARFGQTGTQRVEITSWETPERKLVRFVTELGFGSGTVTHRGRSENGALVIETITEGKTQTASIPWDPAWGGFFAAEQHLSKTPMRPGEKQSFKALVPLFNQVADIEMQAVGPESTELLSGRKELLRIDTKTRLGGGVIESVVWADDQGEPLKESLPALDQVTYRTTRDVALQNGPQPASFDLGWGSVVKVNKRLLRPHETRRVVYLARMKKGDPSASFFKGTTQSVRRVEGNAAEITVRSVRPGVSSDGYPAEPSPGREELSPGSYIQSDDARVVSMAQSVQPASTDAWSLACALERHVCEAVLTKSFAQSLATAADVAKTLEGDCTEHAVLLAAVCRARKIPSRVAMGLVYYPQSRGFAYHMWTEVWIEGGWVPIDGTLGMGGIGAAHLKVCHSNLDGPQSLGVFLSIFELLGQLDLEILSADPPESIESLAP